MRASVSLFALLSAWLCLVTSAAAQQAPPLKYVTQDELQVLRNEVQTIKSDIEDLSRDVNNVLKLLNPAPVAPDKHVTHKELDAAINGVKGDLAAVKELLEQQQDETRRLLGDVAYRKNGVAGLKIRALMDSNPDFQDEMKDAVQRSLPPVPAYGKLIVENRMYSSQYLRINRIGYTIRPLEVREFDVPIGTVAAELVGYEPVKNWFVGAPTYSQRIVIGPTYPYPYVYPSDVTTVSVNP